MKKKILLAGLITTAATAMSSHAVINYIDAAPGNSTGLGTWTPRGSAISADGSAFANFGGVYQRTGAPAGGTTSEIVTTATGLTPGQMYSVSVFFWGALDGNAGNTTDHWQVDASLTAGGASYTHFATTEPGSFQAAGAGISGLDGTLTFTPGLATATASPADDGNRDLWYAVVGDVAANGAGELSVYVNRASQGPGGNVGRSWYDGIGVEAVPEPSAAMLGVLGLLGLLRRRR